MSPHSKAFDRLAERLSAGGTILLDGPVGAELVRRGVRWRKHGLLADADAVRQAHVDHLTVGSDVLRTNTFSLNRRTYLNVFRSPEHMAHIGAPGLDTLAVRLTRCAVEVAREAREQTGRPDVPIAGVLGPLEHVFRPDLAPDETAARAEHGELAVILAEAGADLLLVEAMGTLREARAALAAARETGLPCWVSFALDERAELLSGESLAEAAALAREAGAGAVILTAAPREDVLLGLERLRGLGAGAEMALGAAPMCGRFNPPSWKFEFHPQFGELPTPAAFAADLPRWREAGAQIVGGWGAATPEHVAALRAALDGGAR